MNVIKGLIIKDLFELKSYKKFIIIFVIICALSAFSRSNPSETISLFTVMTTIGFGMFSLATFSYDEISKSDKYITTFPLTRKQIVLARYILVIGATILGSIIGFIFGLIVSLAINHTVPNMYEELCIVMGGIFGIAFIEAVQIPSIYKFGSEKGRMVLFFAILAIAIFGALLFYIGKTININISLETINYIIEHYFLVILALIIAIMYYISYKISVKIYNKKEV